LAAVAVAMPLSGIGYANVGLCDITCCVLRYARFGIGIEHGVTVMSAKNHKRQRRKRQSVTAKREKSQTPKVYRNTNLA